MTPIVEKLFLYASEMNFHPYLSIKEYHHYTQEEEKTEAKIWQLLPAEQTALLEKLRQSRDYNASIGLEAAFQAGLSIGLELSRL